MKEITTVGLDLAKNVLQVHAVYAVVVRREVRRAQVLLFFSRVQFCLIGMEACAEAHCWAQELAKLGHDVRLIPPSYVKPFVKRGKTDAADAEAICEAGTFPNMQFVPVKTKRQRAVLMQHRARDFPVRQLTRLAKCDPRASGCGWYRGLDERSPHRQGRNSQSAARGADAA